LNVDDKGGLMKVIFWVIFLLFVLMSFGQSTFADRVITETVFCNNLERVILRLDNNVFHPQASIYIKQKPSSGFHKFIYEIRRNHGEETGYYPDTPSFDLEARAAVIFREVKECTKLKFKFMERYSGDEQIFVEGMEITAIGR